MFGEFLWSMLGLSYMAGKGISRSASVHAYNKQYEIEKEFLSLCTNEELERGLKADLKTPALRTGVLTRIREYKAKGEGFCVTDALLWELVGVVVLTDEQVLRLAMHTF
jgi:hypothetical protein